MKIVVLDGYAGNPGDLSWDELRALGDLTVYDRTPADRKTILERIGDAELVFTNKTPLSAAIFEHCPNLKFVGILATGYNIVDIDAAKAHGVIVSNVPGYSTDAVTQLTLALLLEICNHVGHHSQKVHAGEWSVCADFCFWDFPLMELAHKTIGIIGFGSIGQSVGKVARALGMKVLATGSRPTEAGKEIGEYVDLDTLYAQSDIISLHCPLFPENREMINKDAIAKMKDGVILLNTARGALIVEQDVADALNSGKIYAAGLDVAAIEPLPATSPLLGAKNCFMTPHIAWATKEARQRLMNIAVDNLRCFLNGTPQNVVNP